MDKRRCIALGLTGVLLQFLLLLWPEPTEAQCNGIFGSSNICGSLTGGPPTAVPFTSFSAASVTGVTSVGNVDGTITVTPTTGSVVISLNTANANTWTASQTFNTSKLVLGTQAGCVQATSGVLFGTGTNCGTGSVSPASVPIFTATTSGAVPASSGGTSGFLRADATFALPSVSPASVPLFTATTSGAVPASSGGTSGFLRADATFALAPVTSVSNVDGTITVTPTTGSVVVSLNTAHANTWSASQTHNTSTLILGTQAGCVQATSGVLFGTGSNCSAGGTPGGSSGQFQYNNSSAFGGANVWRNTTSLTTMSNGTNASGLFVYNTTDTDGGVPTNYERGVFDWTTSTSVLTVGIQSGGTGSGSRAMNLTAGGTMQFSVGGFILENLDTSGRIVLVSSGEYSISSSSGNPANPGDTGLVRNAAGVWGVTSWTNWAGQARLDADFSATSTASLANVTGSSHSLTVTLASNRFYSFEVQLPMTVGGGAGGIRIGFGGTATVSKFIADGQCTDATTVISVAQVTALFTPIVSSTVAGTSPKCSLFGTFEVNAGGTFTTTFAQATSSATASTVKRGAYMFVNDTP